MQIELVVLPDPERTDPLNESAAAGLEALAAALGAEPASITDWLSAAKGEAEHARAVVPGPDGPHLVIGVRAESPHRGPGAPSGASRAWASGLALGGLAAEVADGSPARIWWEWGDPSRDEALWRGVRIGEQRPGSPERVAPEPVFAVGEPVPNDWRRRADAIRWVRELVELPPNLLGPAELAQRIVEYCGENPAVEVEVWDAVRLGRADFGAVLAVGGGSSRPPLVAHLKVPGDPALPSIGLVGKGIAFDSGGLNLKRDAGEMSWMKSDMAAAATVAAAIRLAADERGAGSGPTIEAILPLCDNAVSGSSARPGDVVRHPGGETTEIVDTDCEGRLVLADGLSWLREAGHDSLIDVGTLTDGGAGLRRTGIWSNDEELSARVVAAGERVADPAWILPLPYGEGVSLESRVADSRNAPLDRPDTGRHAAAYLARFAGARPWAHLDIGGTAYLEFPIAGFGEGPTGAGALMLAELLAHDGVAHRR
ncbi:MULTISPECIES: M17 family metallopeptidase [unclassified Leucobacter]|uniref:M17 family metallopeptidase n=1 Tax=unclassified Leucobacter TaxID=2621730 RepID=UPI00069BD3DB|nr:M17 family metallopeptidase [Leucobacter sp. Ag1]